MLIVVLIMELLSVDCGAHCGVDCMFIVGLIAQVLIVGLIAYVLIVVLITALCMG